MKLLIADDEELTRVGLTASLDWKSLGIDQIFQADDGINALNIARLQKPDIILCDVRMPRMDGIQMVERLEEFLPDTSVIFMSGYSDKEYLKAAIKLKAVNYVEKPLNPEEIKEAVQEAIERRERNLRSRQNENLYSMETASHLALLLTKPYKENLNKINSLADELSLRLMPGSSFTTYIVKLKATEPDGRTLHDIRNDFTEYLTHYHLQVFYIQIHAVYHVFHILGNSKPSPIAFSAVESFLTDQFASLGYYFIGRGDTVKGISKAYHSYTSAVVILQISFFFSSGSLLSSAETEEAAAELKGTDAAQKGTETAIKRTDAVLKRTHAAQKGTHAVLKGTDADPNMQERPEEVTKQFKDALLAREKTLCMNLLKCLLGTYAGSRIHLPNQVKDIYYKLFMSINDSRQILKLNHDPTDNNMEESISEYLEKCFTYQELHQMLVTKTEQFFQSIESHVPEDPTIFLIKDYIGRHYADDALSIKKISDHVYLSASYVCTYFKGQTGKTLNQYLTEYRMEKAMQLLSDARYQITDISFKVGYSNGNYFSKSFKKFTGLSPSKYREKMIG